MLSGVCVCVCVEEMGCLVHNDWLVRLGSGGGKYTRAGQGSSSGAHICRQAPQHGWFLNRLHSDHILR
jgi:hypothetical protein